MFLRLIYDICFITICQVLMTLNNPCLRLHHIPAIQAKTTLLFHPLHRELELIPKELKVITERKKKNMMTSPHKYI